MGLSHERDDLQDHVRRAAREPRHSGSRYAAVVETVSAHLDDIARRNDAEARPDDTIEKLRINVVDYTEDGLTGRAFRLFASGTFRRRRYTGRLAGTCDVTPAEVQPDTVSVWPEAVSFHQDEPLVEAPMGDDARHLQRWALLVAGGLVLMSVLGAAAAYLAALELFDQPTTSVPEMLTLAVAVGWSGSCLAAVRSYIDRSGDGVEYDRHVDGRRKGKVVGRAQWPSRPSGTQRFNSSVARGMLLRPLLGAFTAPITYFALFVLSAGVQVDTPGTTPGRSVGYVLIGIAALAGLFAKTMLDNLNEASRNLLKPHGRPG